MLSYAALVDADFLKRKIGTKEKKAESSDISSFFAKLDSTSPPSAHSADNFFKISNTMKIFYIKIKF
jgi:hypothetical protein